MSISKTLDYYRRSGMSGIANGSRQLYRASLSMRESLFEVVWGLFSSKSLSVPLLVTYVWIKLYTFLNMLIGGWLKLNLSKDFAKEILNDLVVLIAPEKQEIPLYLLLTVLCAIFLRMIAVRNVNSNGRITVAINAILTILLILELGPYPKLAQSVPTVWFALVFAIFVALYLLSRMRRTHMLHSVLVLGIIIFITYTPGNPISHHDAAYFLGPIDEISKGKSLFTDVPSQYGFLLIQGLGMLSKYNIFDMSYFPFFVWIGYVVQYFLSFVIVRKLSRSDFFASVSVLAIIVVNYLSIDGIATAYPQVGPLRWLPLLASIVFFRLRHKHLYLAAFLFSLMSLFVIDSGVYMYMALLTTYAYKLMSSDVDRHDIKFVLLITLNTTLLLLVICFGVTLFGYKPITLGPLFHKILQYAVVGTGMIPMPSFTYLYIFTFLYFFAIFHYFRKQLTEYIVYIANCFLVASLYYVGRSHEHNLFNISSISFLFALSLIGIYYQRIQKLWEKRAAIVLIVLLLVLVPSYYRGTAISDRFQDKMFMYKRSGNASVMRSSSLDQVKTYYKEDVAFLKSDSNSSILLLHSDDTYLFWESKKHNLLRENPQSAIISTAEITNALSGISGNECPQYVYISCNLPGWCDSELFLNTLTLSQNYLYDALISKCTEGYTLKHGEKDCMESLCRLTKSARSNKEN